MKRALNLTVFFAIILAASVVWGQAQPEPLLLQDPTLNRTQIVFAYAGDLWIVSRSGGEATRLTAGPGLKTNPKFSPDGQWIAYSAETDGNEDVYVIPAAGGQPKQLTFNPAPDSVEGWTPDGKQVLFRSSRSA